jgi:O-antigen ligase
MELTKLVAIYLTLVNLLNTPKRIAIASGAAVLGALVPAIGTIDQWWRGVDLMDGYRARWLGVYLDPNHLAMSLVAVVPMAVTLAMIAPWAWLKIVSAIAGILFIAAIVFSHSRGGALGLAVAMVLWALLGKKRIRNLAIVGGILVGTAICSPKSFLERTQTISSYEDDVSAHGRVWAWEATAAIIRDRPLTGVGAGAFRDAWPDYVQGYEARLARFVAHNIFLAELGELGILGFILLLGFVSHAIGGAAKAAADSQIGNTAQAVASGFGGYIICDMMSGYVLSAHFFFLAAIAAACGRCLIQSGAVHGKLAES